MNPINTYLTGCKQTFRAGMVLLFLTCSICVNAQIDLNYNLKQRTKAHDYIVPGASMLLSGMLDGTLESISYHYQDGFKRVYTTANDRFWNPEVSWANKYKNGNPKLGPSYFESTDALVFTTDAYHMLRAARNLVNTFTVVYYLNEKRCSTQKVKLIKVLEDCVLLATIRSIGFYSTYSILFRQPN